jgi:elongation factor Ts
MSSEVKASDVAQLRKQTGAGMMDCKEALAEAGGDMEKAAELIRVKMGNKSGKLSDREAAEGTVQSYIHAGGKVGVMVQVDCNTDFVAKNEDFTDFAREVAMHVAASPTVQYVSDEDVPEEAREAEARIFAEQAADKPEEIRPKIVDGMLDKWLGEVVLLRQPHVNADRHEGQTIEEMRAALSAKTGDNLKRLGTTLEKVRQHATRRLGTGELNRVIRDAMTLHPPPMKGTRRLKVFYATQLEQTDPRPFAAVKFLFFVNAPGLLTPTYETYLAAQIRRVREYPGLPLVLELRARPESEKRRRTRGGKRPAKRAPAKRR